MFYTGTEHGLSWWKASTLPLRQLAPATFILKWGSIFCDLEILLQHLRILSFYHPKAKIVKLPTVCGKYLRHVFNTHDKHGVHTEYMSLIFAAGIIQIPLFSLHCKQWCQKVFSPLKLNKSNLECSVPHTFSQKKK